MRLDAHLRRLAAYLYLQDFVTGEVLELAAPDAQAEKVLRDHGASGVVWAEPGRLTAEAAGRFALVVALDVPAQELARVAGEARRLLAPGGRVVIGCESRDHPEAKANAKGG